MTRLRSILRVAACALVPVLAPEAGHAQGVQVPAPTGMVNDFANVIPAEQETQITRIVEEVRAKSGGEIAVVTMPTLQGRTVDELALEIGRQWGVGRRGDPGDPTRNTGMVVLVIPRESSDDGRGHLKIETGTGTTTFVTAAEAGRVADRYMIPAFREQDYGTGILMGVVALAQMYAEQFDFELTGDVPALPQQPADPRGGGGASGIIFFVIVMIFLILSRLGRGGGGRGGRGGGSAWWLLPILLGSGRRGGGSGKEHEAALGHRESPCRVTAPIFARPPYAASRCP